MSSPSDPTAAALIELCCRRARSSAQSVRRMNGQAKAAALHAAADALRADADTILAANTLDCDAGAARGLSSAMLDRLRLDPARLGAIADSVDAVADLPDPVGEEIDRRIAPAGMVLRRVRVPIGVIGIIYESRPNVTIDAAALCVRSGNAVILRGGSEAVHSNRALHSSFTRGLARAGMDADAVQLVPTQDRDAVGAMLAASGGIDLIIPRGGKSLVARVQADARVPVLAHLDGICHSFVHAAANPDMARAIVVNAKLRRTGICGAMETLLIDRDYPDSATLLAALVDGGCEVRGDDMVLELEPRAVSVSDEDWDTEYLDAIVSVALVAGLDGALAHIAAHSSGHTDAIITDDPAAAARFQTEVDSAIVMVNASSQFADGGEFGLGAEIGIATGRLHARGPVALEGLTTYKWLVEGTGQVRT
ncbi:glutamate-5-semialdehyde dehydrogenase [Blastomonas sp.]|uniref:glutamate-5-semialdehyde dehydrogenase n=1 Tax=Blastomonas sp. TaxID=1909299 RepID=UPI00261B5651|nr:glutamate-5-semialdehyde dehydrogenase [Blastomonas sp.]MDM7955469.1 glutamate-5-semialdehyde dehydrogenase [Blastomonas sp.]